MDFGRLREFFGYTLRLAQLRAFARFSGGIGTPAITPAQFTVLLLVEANPGIKQTEIARAIDIDRSTTLRLIERCEAAGYLKRSSSQTDRRAAPPLLTASGRAFLETAVPGLQAAEAEEFGRSLEPDELRTLMRLLRKLNGLPAC